MASAVCNGALTEDARVVGGFEFEAAAFAVCEVEPEATGSKEEEGEQEQGRDCGHRHGEGGNEPRHMRDWTDGLRSDLMRDGVTVEDHAATSGVTKGRQTAKWVIEMYDAVRYIEKWII